MSQTTLNLEEEGENVCFPNMNYVTFIAGPKIKNQILNSVQFYS